MRPLLLFLLCISGSGPVLSQTLKITVTNIRSTSGNIRLYFYTNNETFEKEKPLFTMVMPKTGMQKGTVAVSYTGIKAGTYGIAILDDENNNQDMDYFLFLPKEGFGFSNYYHTGMSKPNFDKFDFILGKEDQAVEIKVRYL